jgi:Tfp pilus assembly protein PilF
MKKIVPALPRMALVAVVVVCAAFEVTSQISGGIEETVTPFHGRYSISGSVFWPDGTPVNSRVRIKLSSLMGTDIISTTDDDGKFFFSRLTNGSYTISIDEDKDHGSASTVVEIGLPSGSPPQTFTTTLRLIEKNGTRSKAPAVINADLAGIPKNAAALYSQALESARQGDHARSIDQLKKAIAAYPRFPLALNELAVQYLAVADLTNAETALQQALAVAPDDPQALLNHGIVLLRMDRPMDASGELQKAVKADPASALAYFYLGRALINVRQVDAAEVAFNRSIIIGGPDSYESHRSLAKIYIDQRDDLNAAAELETYLQLVPKASDAAHLRDVIVQLRNAPPAPKPL